MITFFTTFKDFKGKNRINQFNAIRSWLALDKDVDVIIFSESEGIESVLVDDRITYVKDIELYKGRIPLIGAMFQRASALSKHAHCCYLNGDIIVPGLFINVIKEVSKQLKKNFLLVGQRHDVDVEEELKFTDGWEKTFMEKYQSDFELLPPHAMDYFVFPKGQYESYNFPTLLVGRPGWDLWMIFNAMEEGITTVDLSPSVKVIHQKHDHNHKIKDERLRQEEDAINYKSFPFEEFYFFTAQTCDYAFKNGKLEPNFGRDDNEFFLRMKLALRENVTINKFLLMLISKKSLFSNSFTQSIGNKLFESYYKR